MIYSSRGDRPSYWIVKPEPVSDLPMPSNRLHTFKRDSDDKALEVESIALDLQIRNLDSIGRVNGDISSQQMLEESRDLLCKLIQTTKELQITNRDLTNAVRDHTASQRLLEESRELLRKLISHQEEVREEEGRRIAKEVHDDLGSELTGIKSYLSTIMADNKNRNIPSDSRLEEAAKMTDNASATVQRIIEGLRPSQLDHLPLWDAIDSNSRKILKRNNIKFDSEIQRSVKEVEINPELGTALFRIIQETITNVVRHAAAKSVSLQANLKGNDMTILVRDDGRGITIDRRSHQNSWGIIGMKERVHYFGGDFTITGDPIAGGTIVTIYLPIVATHGN